MTTDSAAPALAFVSGAPIDEVRGGPPVGVLPEFFAYHGFMAPGVHLFRTIGFGAKAAAVSVAFLVPIVWMLISFWSASAALVQSTSVERRGTAYLRELMPMLSAAQDRRRAATSQAPDLPQVQARLDIAWQRVDARQASDGALLADQEGWSALAAQHAALQQQPVGATPSETFQAHSRYIGAVFDLVRQVAAGSQLSLDPDVDTYYLVLGATESLPRLGEQVGRLRGLGNAVLRSGNLAPADRDTLAAALAFADATLRDASESLARAVHADPKLAGELQVDAAVGRTQDYLALARKELLVASPLGDAAAYVTQGNQALDEVYAGIDRTLLSLDRRLQARERRLTHDMEFRLGVVLLAVAIAFYLLGAFYRVTQGGISEVRRQLDEMAAGTFEHCSFSERNPRRRAPASAATEYRSGSSS